MSAQPGVGEKAVVDQHGEQRGEQVGVTAGDRAEVDVGELCRLGAPGIDDDQGALGIVGDRLEVAPGLREAVRLPGVLAPEHGDLGLLVVAGGVAAGASDSSPSTQNSPAFSWARALEL